MRLSLLLIIVGIIAWQYPQSMTIVAEIAGIHDGGSCSAVEHYFTALGDNKVAKAGNYKFPGDNFPPWIDNFGGIDSVQCTCTTDLSDKNIEQIKAIPNSITNVTDIKLTLYTINGTYKGKRSTLKGSALAFRPVSSNWFITQENIYNINGQRTSLINLAKFASDCPT